MPSPPGHAAPSPPYPAPPSPLHPRRCPGRSPIRGSTARRRRVHRARGDVQEPAERRALAPRTRRASVPSATVSVVLRGADAAREHRALGQHQRPFARDARSGRHDGRFVRGQTHPAVGVGEISRRVRGDGRALRDPGRSTGVRPGRRPRGTRIDLGFVVGGFRLARPEVAKQRSRRRRAVAARGGRRRRERRLRSHQHDDCGDQTEPDPPHRGCRGAYARRATVKWPQEI